MGATMAANPLNDAAKFNLLVAFAGSPNTAA